MLVRKIIVLLIAVVFLSSIYYLVFKYKFFAVEKPGPVFSVSRIESIDGGFFLSDLTIEDKRVGFVEYSRYKDCSDERIDSAYLVLIFDNIDFKPLLNANTVYDAYQGGRKAYKTMHMNLSNRFCFFDKDDTVWVNHYLPKYKLSYCQSLFKLKQAYENNKIDSLMSDNEYFDGLNQYLIGFDDVPTIEIEFLTDSSFYSSMRIWANLGSCE